MLQYSLSSAAAACRVTHTFPSLFLMLGNPQLEEMLKELQLVQQQIDIEKAVHSTQV